MKENWDITTDLQSGNFSIIADEFFQLNNAKLDYRKLCDAFSDVVKAKYCIFNLYDKENGSFTSVAISGPKHGILDASNSFGFNLLGRKWARDHEREEIIKNNIITKCTVYDLAGSQLSRNKTEMLINLLGLGQSYIVRIAKNDELIGDLMIIMGKHEVLENIDDAIIFSRLLGMVIIQNRTKKKLETSGIELTEDKLRESEKRFRKMMQNLEAGVIIHAADSSIIDCNGRATELLGLSAEQLIGKVAKDPAWRFINEDKSPMPLEEYPINLILFSKKAIKNRVVGVFKSLESDVTWLIVNGTPILNDMGEISEVAISFIDTTERKQAEIQLKNSEERFANLFKKAPLGYQSLDENGNFIEVNEAWLTTLGYESQEVIGKWFGDFLSDEYVDAFRERFPIFKKNGKIHSEFFMKHKNGELKYIGFEGRIGYKRDGSFEKTHCILQDITEKKLIEERLIESEQTHKALFDFSGVGIGYYTVDGHVISFNPKAAQNMGGKSEDFAGKHVYDLFPRESADIYLSRIRDASNSETSQDYEDLVPLPTGNSWYFSTFSRILESTGKVKGIQIISQDITDLKNKEEKIAYLSYHDQLTGLYNRRYFDEELSRLDTSRNYPLTIVMGDVNGLKIVNDSFGHRTGDELLVCVANSIKQACRQDDIIARVGGDEFTIILPRSDESCADRIIQRINKYISLERAGPLGISISFGYKTKTSENESIESILKEAEDHMYRLKINDSSSVKNKTINMVMNTLFEKNRREMSHSTRVSQICVDIASAMNFGKDDINRIRSAGLLHDIGKIGIQENILNSTTKLTKDEWKEVKKHPEIGFRILSSAPEFLDIAEDVLSHHERWDGNGYPRGITKESISVFARIITIADAFDAMVSERPYRTKRKSLLVEEAINEIRANAGSQFDPMLARIFVEKVMNCQW